MSSTAQASSSTSNVQIVINAALADYTQIAGTDLSKTPFAAALGHWQSNTPEVILQLLQEREKEVFKEYRDVNPRLMECVGLVVKVIQSFSGIISVVVSQVSRTCHPVTLLTVNLSDPIATNECSVCRH